MNETLGATEHIGSQAETTSYTASVAAMDIDVDLSP